MRHVLRVNSENCTGCQSCVVTCSFVKHAVFDKEKSLVSVLKDEDRCLSIPLICEHCEVPACVDVCPTSAIAQKHEQGIVSITLAECTGCAACVDACPFGADIIRIVEGRAIKCDLCGGDPACVPVCQPKALQYVWGTEQNVRVKEAFAQKRMALISTLSTQYPRRVRSGCKPRKASNRLGYAGRILHVDLSTERIWREELSLELCRRYIGARGINVKLWWDLVRQPGIDPLSEENPLIFGIGTLTSSSAPSNGRLTVTSKSPLTHLYVKSSAGGHWGAELKFAGYDHLVIHGASETPVYLWIDDDVVEVQDASSLWGEDVRTTNARLKKGLHDVGVKVACIGEGGEHQVPYASILFSVYNTAARGGTGAVMGAKRLKAIAVRGTGEVRVKDPDLFNAHSLEMRNAFWTDRWGLKYWLWGTGGFLPHDDTTYNNWSQYRLPGAGLVSGPWMLRKHYFHRRHGCFGCSMSCHRYTEVSTGPYQGTYTCGPEAGTWDYGGHQLGIIDFETIVKTHDVCDMVGLDSFSTGAVIAWAMECYERGVLTPQDTEGLDLFFGNEDAAVQLISMIARREGVLGQLLAHGVRQAAQELGKDSHTWANYNSKGMSGGEVRIGRTPYALAYAVNPRGPDHLHTEPYPSLGWTPQQREWTERVSGKTWPSWTYFDQDHVPEIIRWLEDCYAVTDSLGLCAFLSTSALAATPENMAALFSSATGFDVNGDELMKAGRRIVTLEKCFNVREGADRRSDDLSHRFMHEPVQGMVCSRDWLDPLLDKYYRLHGWDVKTSWPYEATLVSLGLAEVVPELQRLKKLPGNTES